MRKRFKYYAVYIALSLGVGLAAALMTAGNMELYGEITQPPLSPPGFLFPLVWTLLYILMGVGAAMVRERAAVQPVQARAALRLFFLQLAVNFFWSLIFFNLRAFLFAFIWLLALWCLIVLMILRFAAVSPLAAKLQLPYLLWVTFAGYLNLGVYLLNR